MISALKILFTLVVVAVVYWGFKYRWRMSDMGKSVRDIKKKRTKSDQNRASPTAQDLVRCPKCDAYIPAGSTCSCEES